MNKETSKELKAKRSRLIEEVSKKLIENNDLEGSAKDLDWIRTANELIDSAHSPPSWLGSLIIGIMCLSIAGFAWFAPISLFGITPGITFEVFTDNVILTLNKDRSFSEPFTVNEFQVDDITSANSPGSEEISNVKKSLEVNGVNIEVSKLELSKGARIEVGARSNQAHISITKSPFKGTLNVSQASVTIDHTSPPIVVPAGIPESIKFTADAHEVVPIELRLESKDKWRLSGFKVKGLSFMEEKTPDSGNFESVIHSGKITVLQTSAEYTLLESDRLILKDIKESKRLTLSRSQDNKVRVFFEGTVSKIKAGPEDLEKNLTPSLLQYVYHQQQIIFLGSAALFLWSMLWSVRNTIFR